MILINAIWVFLFLKQIRIYHLNLHETLSKTVVLISQIRKTFKNIFDRFQKVTLPIFAMIYSTTKYQYAFQMSKLNYFEMSE